MTPEHRIEARFRDAFSTETSEFSNWPDNGDEVQRGLAHDIVDEELVVALAFGELDCIPHQWERRKLFHYGGYPQLVFYRSTTVPPTPEKSHRTKRFRDWLMAPPVRPITRWELAWWLFITVQVGLHIGRLIPR